MGGSTIATGTVRCDATWMGRGLLVEANGEIGTPVKALLEDMHSLRSYCNGLETPAESTTPRTAPSLQIHQHPTLRMISPEMQPMFLIF